MIKAVILYGSKARSDHDRFSDTDLIGVSNSDEIEKPFDQLGVSLHLYPHEWLTREAKGGSLFLLHIVTEAVAMFDPFDVLSGLRSDFQYRDSYHADAEIGSRIVSAVMELEDREFTPIMRKRYFWGLRTALMADAAEKRLPKFSAKALESASKISGLSLHIQTRTDATLAECRRFGAQVLERLGVFQAPVDNEAREENLRFLFGLGGVGTATAAEIIYSFKPDLHR
ncbi:hypothetical protein A0J57_21085 [Sphingobium sp. 22B]|uniref:hypothetical protein n=1 Tax=unclassified Sphingobium TaxID=2611147 RepID=UPI0007831164|nr:MULTISPECIES: hypothetical protein [unclassified Sphingobium]KXU30238.1 hypothetical protein AXW74_18690 [Sphingobium sp. AM]KYC30328.1 hypothetical protein A0J57_21085 [Sphingobium sp. 22B]OAP29919.1 hypothetical protein A8O16_21060 [Sphingobium sp. 20006FA]